ncbi:WD repeat-containing protein 11-like [Watersipora subatra]|uniref:WD repeat-containing protein 11-like n=1 Tax=Watersipora subatra TaxID=2589382 RepID=UPI00355BFB10
MRIAWRTITGSLVEQNKGALAWSETGLIAYGANTLVAVVNSNSMQHVTSLNGHKSCVTKLCWAPSSLPRDVSSSNLYLASADVSGVIMIFDVNAGSMLHKLSELDRPVSDLELFYPNSTDLALLSLHQPALLVLCNAITGEQFWKKSFADPMIAFSRDPFNSTCVILNGGTFVQYVKDFATDHSPSDGQKLQLITNGETVSDFSRMEKNKKPAEAANQSVLILNESPASVKSGSTDPPLSQLMKIQFHKTRRDTLLLVYKQDLQLVDMEIRQTVATISLDRSTCPFVDVYPCWSRDVIYCLHDNGTVVLRLRKLMPDTSGGSPDKDMAACSYSYEALCSTDGVRVTRSHRVYGLAVCPISELRAAVLMSDGKLLAWQLQAKPNVLTHPSHPIMGLSDVIRPSTTTTVSKCVIDERRRYSFLLTGITSCLSQAPFIVKMCPPLTTKNYHVYRAFVAIGSMTGVVQIYDINNGSLYRDLSVHTCQVRAIEWTSLHSFISHASQKASGNGGSSELAFVDVRTGKVVNFRQAKPDESIHLVRVSQLKQYMVIVFKGKPMELWDLRTLTLLREMPNTFPTVTALEWSPSSGRKKHATDEGHTEGTTSLLQVKEHFVFTDNTGLLHSYNVEGSILKQISKMGIQGVTGTVTALAWRHETLSLGDVNSNVSFWDLKNKNTVNFSLSKGMVRKMRFAPGKENNMILILFNEELQIWDKNTYAVISSLKFPASIGRVNDADWCCSDKVILSVADGYVAIADALLSSFMSPLLQSTESSLPPSLMPSQLSLRYQAYCSHISSHLTPTQLEVSTEEQCYLADKTVSVADRCLTLAYIFGDRFLIDFWTIAGYYLKSTGVRAGQNKIEHRQCEALDKDAASPSSTPLSSHADVEPLESSYNFFCENNSYKNTELERALLQNMKSGRIEARLDCTKKFILLGEHDRAVHTLLQTEPDCPTFYLQSLRACLLATITTSGASQSTIKLVATSLIAHGKLEEGIELLCLIEKSADACRYLQTYGQWAESIRLAKVTLERQEVADVVSRWITEYLSSPPIRKMGEAVLAATSVGDLLKAVELLYSQQCFSTAAMFLEACNEYQLLPQTEQTLAITEAVYSQYARLLKEAGLTEQAAYFGNKAETRGAEQLTGLS